MHTDTGALTLPAEQIANRYSEQHILREKYYTKSLEVVISLPQIYYNIQLFMFAWLCGFTGDTELFAIR